MAGQGVVLRGEPVFEAVVGRLRLARQVEHAVQVPFADVGRGVAGPLQQGGDGDLLRRKCIGDSMGIQLWMPMRVGVRPVIKPARDGEQLAPAE